MTLDCLIDRLKKLKDIEGIPGTCRMNIDADNGRVVEITKVLDIRVAKNDPNRIVSRKGTPALLIR